MCVNLRVRVEACVFRGHKGMCIWARIGVWSERLVFTYVGVVMYV